LTALTARKEKHLATELLQRQLQRIRRWGESGLALVLPPSCAHCGDSLDVDAIQPQLCSNCRAIFTPSRRGCERCGAMLENELGCRECQNQKFAFDRVVALGTYAGALRESVVRMKYDAGQPLASALGRHLARHLDCMGCADQFDLVTCVPKHWFKRLITGINSPEVIMEGIAEQANLPQAADLLVCRRRINKQSMLSPEQRRRNVRKAWSVSTTYDITGSQILVVDDILTTGATAHEVSRALKRAGAKRVTLAVIGRAKKMQ